MFDTVTLANLHGATQARNQFFIRAIRRASHTGRRITNQIGIMPMMGKKSMFPIIISGHVAGWGVCLSDPLSCRLK